MHDLEEKLEALTKRVQALEDELAIHRLVVRYGVAVDIGDARAAAEVFAEDAVYDADVLVMNGRGAVSDMVNGPRHQGMVGRCAHQIGPLVVRVNGDVALAIGYSRVYLREGDTIRIYRVSYNRWELQRRAGQWRIVRRLTRLLGHDEARGVFEQGLIDLPEE